MNRRTTGALCGVLTGLLLGGLVGCFSTPSVGGLTTPSAPSGGAGLSDVVDTGILNWVFGACILAAVATVVVGAWFPIPKKTTGALVACAVGALILRVILVKLLWPIVIVSCIGLVLAVVAWYLAHRAWIEQKIGVDLNRDGKIGV